MDRRLPSSDPRPNKRTKPLDPPHIPLAATPQPQGAGTLGIKPMSWKDKVLSQERSKETAHAAKERHPVNLIENGIVTRAFKDGNMQFPVFCVDPAYMATLEAPWKQSVVVKLLGRSISYQILYDKIELWKPAGGFDVLDIGHDYFLVKFDHGADFDFALEKGP